MSYEPTDLPALVRQAAAEQQATTERHRIVVETAEPKLVGAWDSGRLERRLGHLLSNVVKFSPQGGRITVAMQRPAAAVGHWAVLTVGDAGVGIPLANLPRILEQFHRGTNVAGAIPGTGINLGGEAPRPWSSTAARSRSRARRAGATPSRSGCR